MRRWSDIADDFLLLAGLVVLFLVPHRISSDGAVRFEALSQLLTSWSMPDSRYSMIGPLMASPLWWLGMWLGTPEQTCKFFNWLVLVVFIAAFDCLLHESVERSLRRKIQLLLLIGSMFAAAQKDFFGDMVATTGISLGIMALLQGRWWGGFVMALGAANVPATIPAAALAVLWITGRKRQLRFLTVGVLILTLVLLENAIRHGGPLNFGYEGDHGVPTMLPFSGQPGFSYPFGFGVLSILLSFGKGLLFFAPGLLLPIHRFREPQVQAVQPLHAVSLLFTVGLVLTYARWWAWYGGLCWGPRFFLAASVPASIALAVWLQYRRSAIHDVVALLGLALSCWVGFSGAICDQCDLARLGLADNFAHEHLMWYVPEFSVLWRPLVAPNTWKLRPGIATIYWLAVFAWLSWPVAARLLNSIRRTWRLRSRVVAQPWTW